MFGVGVQHSKKYHNPFALIPLFCSLSPLLSLLSLSMWKMVKLGETSRFNYCELALLCRLPKR